MTGLIRTEAVEGYCLGQFQVTIRHVATGNVWNHATHATKTLVFGQTFKPALWGIRIVRSNHLPIRFVNTSKYTLQIITGSIIGLITVEHNHLVVKSHMYQLHHMVGHPRCVFINYICNCLCVFCQFINLKMAISAETCSWYLGNKHMSTTN